MPRHPQQLCLCCKTNTFRKSKSKKFCKNCSEYIGYKVEQRIAQVIMMIQVIKGEK